MMQMKTVRTSQSQVVELSKTLVAQEPMLVPPQSQLRIMEVVDDPDESLKTIIHNDIEDRFYILEEFDNVDKPMAYLVKKFSNIRFKRPRNFSENG